MSKLASRLSLCASLSAFAFGSFGATYYVATDGNDGNDGSSGAPFATIGKAVAAATDEGDVIQVGAGEFALPVTTLENAVGWKLRGAGVDQTALICGSRHTRCFNVSHASAEFCDLTIKDLTVDEDNGFRKTVGVVFNLSAGSLHDLVIKDINTDKSGNLSGLGVYMTGGHLADIVFDNCHNNRSDMDTNGSAVWQSAGLSERLTIRNCYGRAYGALYLTGGSNTWSKIYGNEARFDSAKGGGVTITGGTLVHATIWGNGAGTNGTKFTGAMGGGLYHSGGVVTNCIVYGNSAPSQTAAGKPDWYTTKTKEADQKKLFFSLCATAAAGTNPIPLDPQLNDPAHADFALRASSPCILEDGTTVGAVPYDRTKVDAAMTVSPRAAFTTDEIAFAATVRNVANPVYSWTVTDASGAEVKTSDEPGFSASFDVGSYDVTLAVSDGATPVATDVRAACFRVHPLTNVVEKAGDEAVATAELEDALANAIDGQVILLGEGEWKLPAERILVDKAVTVIGAGVDKTVFVAGSRHDGCLRIDHDAAEFSGFTLRDLTWDRDNTSLDRNYKGHAIYLEKGFLHDVRIANITVSKTYYNYGAALYMAAGHAADVTIEQVTGAQGASYAAMYQAGGLAERCDCFDCQSTQYGGGLYLKGGVNSHSKFAGNVAKGSKAQGGGVCMTGGTLEHATIWGNGAGTDKTANTGAMGGGLYHSGGVVTNCIAFGNAALSQTTTGKPDWHTTKTGAADQAKLFFNFCSSVGLGTDPIVGDPQLKDPDNGDFSPTASSPCIFPTFTVGAVEYDRSEPDASMAVAPVRAFDTESVCFTSSVVNVSNPVYAWTVTDADGQVVKESSEACFETTFAKGVYDVRLVVKDGEKEVKTDERLGLVHIYTVTNVIAAGVADALKDAVDDSLDGQVFLLEAGLHEVTGSVMVNTGVKIVGTGAENCIVMKTGKTDRVFLLNNENALLTGVAVTGGRFDDSQRESWGAGVLVGDNGGTVSFCTITNNGTSSGHFMRGGGVGITGEKGLVTHCLIAGNSVSWKQRDFGGGAALSSGRLENCLIRDNDSFCGGGVMVSGMGKVRNCTIVNNSAGTTGGGLCWWQATNGKAEVRNCVFSGNVADSDISTVKPNVGFVDANGAVSYDSSSNSVFSCGYEGSAVLGVGSAALTNPFKDAAAGNWHLKLGVAGVDAGTAYAGGDAFAATDYDGCARVIGDAIDMGAYETDTEAFGAAMNIDRTAALENDPFVASASVTGSTGYDCAWTVYGPDGAVVANSSSAVWTNGFDAVGRYDIELTVTDRADPFKTVTDRRNGIIYVGPRAINLVAGDDLFTAVEAALGGTKITLAAGEYVITNKFKIQKGVTIEGPGYRLCTVRPADTIVGDRRVFHLNHADAVLRGVTVTGGRLGTADRGSGDTRGLMGGGVYIDADGGLVENCRLTGNQAGTYDSHGGGVAVNSDKGVVRNCLIDHNDVNHSGTSNETGGGVYMAKGAISNCVICANRAALAGGVYVAGDVTIASCTIASNAANTVGGIYFGSINNYTDLVHAKLRDSIIWGNADKQGAARDGTSPAPEYGGGLGGTIPRADLINYCAFSEGTLLPVDDLRQPVGEGNFTCADPFVGFDRLNLSLHHDSPCAYRSSAGSFLGALKPLGLKILVR